MVKHCFEVICLLVLVGASVAAMLMTAVHFLGG